MRNNKTFHLIQSLLSQQPKKGEKAMLYNNYLYRMKCTTQKGTSLYVCTNKSRTRRVTLQNDTIIK